MTSSNQSDSVGSTLGSLGAMTACTLGAGIAGGVLYMAVQRMNRARAASRRLSELIAAATSAGEARIVITGATSGVGEELAQAFSRSTPPSRSSSAAGTLSVGSGWWRASLGGVGRPGSRRLTAWTSDR